MVALVALPGWAQEKATPEQIRKFNELQKKQGK